MRKIFSMDNPLMRGLSIAADLIILNLLTIVLCLPLVTIGPALTAMNDIVIHLVRGEEGYIIIPYFQSFKANFKKGLLFSLVTVLAVGILVFDYLALNTYFPELRVSIVAVAVVVLAIGVYLYGLQARYENTFRNTVKSAAVLAVVNFPRTLGMMVCTIGLWVVCINFYQFGIPILLMMGLSLPCYVNILLLNRVFRKLEGADSKKEGEEESEEETEEQTEQEVEFNNN